MGQHGATWGNNRAFSSHGIFAPSIFNMKNNKKTLTLAAISIYLLLIVLYINGGSRVGIPRCPATVMLIYQTSQSFCIFMYPRGLGSIIS